MSGTVRRRASAGLRVASALPLILVAAATADVAELESTAAAADVAELESTAATADVAELGSAAPAAEVAGTDGVAAPEDAVPSAEVAATDPVAAPEDAAPEDVSLRVVVEGTAPTAVGARSEADLRLRILEAAVAQAPVAVEEVTVGEPEITAVYERRVVPRPRGHHRTPRIERFRVRIPVTLTVGELEWTELLVDTVVGAGALVEPLPREPWEPW